MRDLQQGITHRFDVDRFCVGAQLLIPGLWIVRIHEVICHSERVQILRDEIVRAAVEAILNEQVVSCREHRQQRGRNCRHAAGGDQRRICVLRSREFFVQRLVVRCVVQTDVFQTVIVRFVGVFKIRRLKNRHAHGALNARLRLTRVDQFCFQTLRKFCHAAAFLNNG